MSARNQKIDRPRPLEDQAVLKEWLDYDPETGNFRWKKNRPSQPVAGRVAGSLMLRTGYIEIMYQGISYLAHRLAWVYMTGELPLRIDHISGVRGDNRWINLRPCTHAENMRNRKMHSNNACGFKGVWRRLAKTPRPYVAQIRVDGKTIRIGSFESPELAHDAYLLAASTLHGEFSRQK